MKSFFKAALLIAMLCIASGSHSQYVIREAFPNLTFAYPVELVHPGDGTNRLFVLEKGGRVLVFNNDQNVTSAKVFLDITDRVSAYFYAGLFGIAFHPDYSSNKYFYVYYLSGTGASLTMHLSRFTASPANPDSALQNSELDILTLPCPSSNHNGSSIRFGADGFLYFGFGDSSPGSGGDPENKAQNRSEMFGKVHRINVDSASGGRNYSIPPSNPYYQNTSGYREEIYAYGFRNMWKFTFDETTGRLWLADVGQTRWEEINIVEAGKNYGWRRKEGFVCYNPSSNCDTAGFVPVDPLYVYGHSLGTCVAGGYVYRGSRMPGLEGKYVYSDYTTGRIWALTWDGINPPVNQELFDTPYSIVSFAEDKFKNLFFIHFAASTGKIYKIIDSTVTSSGTVNSEVISDFILYQNYPNPFNPSTLIRYSLKENGFISLKVYDITGKEILTLVNEYQNPGNHSINFNAGNLSSGIYYYTMTVNGIVNQTKRMVLLN